MIQRIQHVYLFIALFLVAILIPIPFCYYNCAANNSIFNLKLSGLFDSENQMVYEPKNMLILSIVSFVFVVVSLATIFLFKNRKLQIRLTYFLIVTLIFFGFLLGSIVMETKYFLPADCDYSFTPGWGIFLPILSFIFILLALAGIKKDDNLIKSVDRLR